jgi:hypothetical protein
LLDAPRKHDGYRTPAENVAGLVIGLQRAGAHLPPTALDHCGGGGDIGRTLPMRAIPLS